MNLRGTGRRPRRKPHRLLIHGDSWSAALPGPDYPDYLTNRFEVVKNAAVGARRLFGESFGGSVEDKIAEDLVGIECDFVVILTTAGNDIMGVVNDWFDPTPTTERIQQAVQSIAADCGAIPVIWGSPVMAAAVIPSEPAATMVQEVSDWLADWAPQNGHGYIDLSAALCDEAGIKPEYDSGDGAHLTPAGKQRVAELVMQAIGQFRL